MNKLRITTTDNPESIYPMRLVTPSGRTFAVCFDPQDAARTLAAAEVLAQTR